MRSNKLNFKLLNFLILVGIIYLLYSINSLWSGVVSKILQIGFPFLIAFGIAYALHPVCKKLEHSGGIPRWLALLLVIVLTLGILIIIIILVVPLLYDQLLLFLSNISTLISDLATKYELNLGPLQSSVAEISAQIVKTVGSYISDGAINIVNSSINFGTAFIVVLFVSIYFLIDMDRIREFIKTTFAHKRKTYNYIKALDTELSNYFIGFGKNMLVQTIEYTTVFFIIGHPNYLILGCLAAISGIIPIFGGLIVNIIALLIAAVISPTLFWLTLIVCCVCPQIDSYVIAPKIYGKTNKIHPLINIFAVFTGGILGGIWGIIISLPIAIIIMTTYKYYKKDINKTIEEIKVKK